MIKLIEYIKESLGEILLEGGAGGHMSHPYEYTELTGNDIIELVEQLFSGKIENIKEKLDGTNIHATMNTKGEVVFIRNKSNLNDPRGGMSIQDMANKWAENPSVANTFITAGKIITKVFNKLGVKYFNPDSTTRKVINCECIIAGKTNVMPYTEDRVAFHGYKIYKNTSGIWNEVENVEGNVNDIYKAAENIKETKPRPDLIIKNVEVANKFSIKFKKDIEKLFKSYGLTLNNTLDDLKFAIFNNIKPQWVDKEIKGVYNRWCNRDKSLKASELKKLYPDNYDNIKSDTFAKVYVNKVMEPIDDIFMQIGNAFINLVDGLTNSANRDSVVDTLKHDIEDVVSYIEKNGTEENKQLLQQQLLRLSKLGDNSLNSAEGIVFMYNGKLMKLTGSFAAVNKILGITKFNR